MSNPSRRRPSPALIVAILALLAAFAGTAIAADPLSRAVTKSKVKNIAAKQVVKLAPELDVASAKSADNAKTADKATTAANTFGVEWNGSGVGDSTIPGATAQKSGNTITWTFPRNVVDCVPVVSGEFNSAGGSQYTALQLGPGDPNKVRVSVDGAVDNHNLTVTCP